MPRAAPTRRGGPQTKYSWCAASSVGSASRSIRPSRRRPSVRVTASRHEVAVRAVEPDAAAGLEGAEPAGEGAAVAEGELDGARPCGRRDGERVLGARDGVAAQAQPHELPGLGRRSGAPARRVEDEGRRARELGADADHGVGAAVEQRAHHPSPDHDGEDEDPEGGHRQRDQGVGDHPVQQDHVRPDEQQDDDGHQSVQPGDRGVAPGARGARARSRTAP